MYVEHPYKFNDKFYAKVDGKFYEITREVAKAMLSAYRNEVYRSKKWQPEDPETMTRKTKWTGHKQKKNITLNILFHNLPGNLSCLASSLLCLFFPPVLRI